LGEWRFLKERGYDAKNQEKGKRKSEESRIMKIVGPKGPPT